MPYRFSVLALVALLLFGLSGPSESQMGDPAPGRVTLTAVGVPLAQIAGSLSSEQARLTIGPELRDLKATVLVRERPRVKVQQRIAQVFGAEWVSTGEAPPTYELRRTREVSRWLAQWKAARRRAALEAREARAARTRRYMDDLIQQARKTPTQSEDPAADPPEGSRRSP